MLLYIELDKADPIVEDILPVLSNKQPKLIAASLSALTSIFHAYGVKIVDPKPVLKALPKIFGHADKNVRAEASNLAVELYRWLREAIKTLFWNDLKPVQQQDLEKLFETIKQEPPPKQERLLRSQQDAPAASKANVDTGAGEEDDVDEPAETEAFDLAEPVDVYSKIPNDFQENLASTKWKDRQEALKAFYEIAKTERIKEGPFDEMVSTLAKCMKDANILVVTVAANCVEALARGLRRSFGKYRSKIMAPMLERLKEKKQAVADALGGALDAVFLSTSLSDCLEEILEALKHKNPQVKLETLRLLIRCLKTTRDAPSAPETKLIADAAIKLLTESTEVARSGGAEALGTLMKIMGERAMNPYLDGLDDIRKTKIKEYFDIAEVKAKNKPKPVAPPKAAPPAQKKMVSKKPPAGLKKPAPRASTPLEDPPPPAPSAVKPITRPGVASKLGGPPKSGLAAPTGGLKLQKKLAGPGGSAPPSFSSPKRNTSPQNMEDTTPVPTPRISLGGRGLAGRPLSKPTPIQPEPLVPTISSGLSNMERAELEELRGDKRRLQEANDELLSQKARLEIEISELRNHEAQLIEERTHHKLTISAKETQVVRALSSSEVAQETVQKQQREIDRLKRELARSVRTTSPPPYSDVSDQIYRDGSSSVNGGSAITVAGLDRYESNRVSKEIGYQRARSYMSSPSEEKENGSLEAAGAGVKGSVGMNSPSRLHRDVSDSSTGGSPGRSRLGAGQTATGEPIESWKRAAEVTSQLKARIEQMKVC